MIKKLALSVASKVVFDRAFKSGFKWNIYSCKHVSIVISVYDKSITMQSLTTRLIVELKKLLIKIFTSNVPETHACLCSYSLITGLATAERVRHKDTFARRSCPGFSRSRYLFGTFVSCRNMET